MQDIFLRFHISPIDIDVIAQDLERIKANSYRQCGTESPVAALKLVIKKSAYLKYPNVPKLNRIANTRYTFLYLQCFSVKIPST